MAAGVADSQLAPRVEKKGGACLGEVKAHGVAEEDHDDIVHLRRGEGLTHGSSTRTPAMTT